jgi:hypothetical protein
MKKFTLLFCIIFIFGYSVSQAQTYKGKILVGVTTYLMGLPVASSGNLVSIGFGNTTYSSSDGDSKASVTNFSIQPKAGYFISDKLAVGLEALIVSSSLEGENSSGKEIESIFLAGPFARYYVPVGKFLPFVEAEAGMGKYHDKWTGTYDYDDKYDVFAMGAGAGVEFSVWNKAAFDFCLAYNWSSSKFKGANAVEEKTVTGVFGLKVGFIVLLGGN